MRALIASRSIVGLPGVSLVPCIPNTSRGYGNQVGAIEVIILESNRSNNRSRHGFHMLEKRIRNEWNE